MKIFHQQSVLLEGVNLMGGTPLLILVLLLGSAAVVEVVDKGFDGVFLAFMGVTGSNGEADFTAGACDGNLDCIPSRLENC